ncbi:MAG: DNA mobilization endonuclease VirD1/MobC family subunit [Pseudomonadota bacterium]
MNGDKQSLKVARPAKRSSQTKTTQSNSVRREAIKREGLDGYTNLNVRLRNAEFLEFSDQVEAAGLTNNRALRIAARRIAGFIEIDAESRQVLYAISRELGRIGVNINQLTKIANTINSVDHAEFLKERQAMTGEFVKLQSTLHRLLNITARKQDGLARLEKASQE